MTKLVVDLGEIQGDVLALLQKDIENFVFFKIAEKGSFKELVKRHIIGRITTAQRAQQRELTIQHRKEAGEKVLDEFVSLNLGFTRDGLSQLIGAQGVKFDPAFERGAADQHTIKILNDPPCRTSV